MRNRFKINESEKKRIRGLHNIVKDTINESKVLTENKKTCWKRGERRSSGKYSCSRVSCANATFGLEGMDDVGVIDYGNDYDVVYRKRFGCMGRTTHDGGHREDEGETISESKLISLIKDTIMEQEDSQGEDEKGEIYTVTVDRSSPQSMENFIRKVQRVSPDSSAAMIEKAVRQYPHAGPNPGKILACGGRRCGPDGMRGLCIFRGCMGCDIPCKLSALDDCGETGSCTLSWKF